MQLKKIHGMLLSSAYATIAQLLHGHNNINTESWSDKIMIIYRQS